MDLVKVRPKGQVTVPEHIRRQARIGEGDFVEVSVEDGRIVLTPKAVIDADQAWFWTPSWQAREQEADAALAEGRVERYDSDEAFLESLN